MRILTLLNEQMAGKDSIRRVLGMVQEFTGFDAVAIRLREGDDFPYFITNGFSDDFVEAENSLCVRTDAGEIMMDPAGNPILECMCGNILCGRTDPSFSFFTQGGSFWSSHTTELLATTSEADRQARTRNRCNAVGYESVALIPLRSDRETIGLLQLNDSRKDRFTLDIIKFFEGIGASIGIVLGRMRAEEALRKSSEELEARVIERTEELRKANEQLQWELAERRRAEEALRAANAYNRSLIETSLDPMVTISSEGKITDVNMATERVTGCSREDLIGTDFCDYFTEPQKARDGYQQAFKDGSVEDYELHIRHRDGHFTPVIYNASVYRDRSDEIVGVFSAVRDITERKKMEGEIRASVARLKEAQRVARMGSWELDLVTNQVFWSDEIYRMFEMEPREFGGSYEAFLDLIHPDDRETVNRAYTDSLANKGSYEIIHRLKFPDGRITYVHERWEHSFDGEGVAVRSVGTVQDITELTQVQVRLENERAQLRTLVETIPDLIWLKNPDGVYLTCNPSFERFFGAKEADIVGKTDYDFVDVDLAAFFREHDRKAMAAGKPSLNEEWLTFADTGYHGLFETIKTPMRDSEGNLVGVLGISRDITDHKRAEEKLRESEERYRTVADFNYDWEYWVDAQYKLLYVSPSCERITGYSAQEFTDDPGLMDRIVHPDDRDEVSNHFLVARKIDNERSYNLDFRIIRRDGEPRWISHVSRPVHGQAGQPLGRRASNRDITERKNLEQQFLQAQKMESIGTLAGGVAHDFNNILQVALGYAELILGDEELPGHFRADLQRIHESARRGADLVQRLLTFSRKTEIKPQPLSVNRRITELRKMLERTIPKMIDIQLHLGENIATINADPTQIDQALMNLAVNARDAMPEGGKLIVETANIILDEEYARVHLEAKPGHHVLLMVTDTGSGMNNDTLEHIFEPFYTTKAMGAGTGLGLAMVHGIVRKHGGHIRCYSEPGRGTTFKLYFPALVTNEVAEESCPRPMPPGGAETILLVDDDQMIRDLCARILTRSGYHVITASNGKEALELYEAQGEKISLVILDLIMPEMGGRQCLERLLNLDPSVRVIIASGYSADGPTKEVLNAGAKRIVNKPYDIGQVLAVVRGVLDSEYPAP